MTNKPDIAIDVAGVWKVFGERAGEAMQALRGSPISKAEVLKRYGCVGGVADASFQVERGEIVYPVNEVTIAGNLAELLRNIVAIGSDIDVRGTVRCGAVRVEGMTLAGGG